MTQGCYQFEGARVKYRQHIGVVLTMALFLGACANQLTYSGAGETSTPLASISYPTLRTNKTIQASKVKVGAYYNDKDRTATLVVWNTSDGQELARQVFTPMAPIGDIALSPDETQVAFTDPPGGLITVWDFYKDTSKRPEVFLPDGFPSVDEIAFSPDGKLLAANIHAMQSNHNLGRDVIAIVELASGLVQILPRVLVNQRFDHFTGDGQALIVSGCTRLADSILGSCEPHSMTTTSIDLRTVPLTMTPPSTIN
jgi:hypothetical protein